MKILHISRSMGQGGAEKIVYQLCMDNKNCEQVIISAGGYYVHELEGAGIKHYIIPDMDKKNPRTILKCFWKIFCVIKNEDIDIVHTHHRMAAFYAQVLSFFVKIKKIYTAHNVFYGKKKLVRFSLRKTIIVAVGNGVKKNLIEEYGIPERQIIVIKNTIKIENEQKEDLLLKKLRADGKKLIGTIGRLSEQKGMDIYIKSMKHVIEKYPDVIGVIVGDGENRHELEQLVEQLELKKNIVFLGYQRNVLSIIKYFDFVVLASRWEGLPLTPIEVFSQGKTIIASDISGNNEVIVNGANGLLCEKDNTEDFVEKIQYLIINSEKRISLEKNALKTYQKEYSYDLFIKKYMQTYEKIKNGKV